MDARAVTRSARRPDWLAAAVLLLVASTCQAGPAQLAVPASSQESVAPSIALGSFRVVPSLQVGTGGFWGPSAIVETASGWFAGASYLQRPTEAGGQVSYGLIDSGSLSAGYRWTAGNSLSLALTRSTGLDYAGSRVQRLGLAVRYDWPTYYVRMGLEPQASGGLSQNTLRLSAGFRF